MPAGMSPGIVTYRDHVQIDHDSGTPVWRQLADILRGQIASALATYLRRVEDVLQPRRDAAAQPVNVSGHPTSGEIGRGKLLPSTRTLMQRYEVSDGTVKRAVAQLRAEGLVKTEPGRGVYVA